MLPKLPPLRSRDVAVARTLASHHTGRGSILRPCVICQCGLSLLLVLVLSPRVFLPASGFPPPQNPTLINFNSIGNSEGHGFIGGRIVKCYPRKTKFLYIFIQQSSLAKNKVRLYHNIYIVTIPEIESISDSPAVSREIGENTEPPITLLIILILSARLYETLIM